MSVSHKNAEIDLSLIATQFPFESERLQIRRLHNNDFSNLFAYRNDAEVAKFQSWTDKSETEIQALIDEKPTLGTVGEWFTFALALKDTDQLIGECAFCINENFPDLAEMGITLSAQAQGKGYAREAINAILNFVFTTIKVESVVFITYMENKSCINLVSQLQAAKQIDAQEAETNEKFSHFGLRDNEIMFSIARANWI